MTVKRISMCVPHTVCVPFGNSEMFSVTHISCSGASSFELAAHSPSDEMFVRCLGLGSRGSVVVDTLLKMFSCYISPVR